MKVRVECEFEGLFVDVQVEQHFHSEREATHHDYNALMIRATRAVASAYGMVKADGVFDQDKTQPMSVEEYNERQAAVPYQ